MRLLLRRHIKDPVGGGNWEDPDLTAHLNAGLQQIQRLVKQAVPHAFITTGYINLVANTQLYAQDLLTPDPWWIYSVRKLDSTSGLYSAIERKAYDYLLLYPASETTTIWSKIGRSIAVAPIPTISQTNGLEIVYEPILSMSLDADIPAIHEALHMAIVLWAKLFFAEESGESSENTRKTLAEMLSDIPSYYPHEGEPQSFSPQIFKTDYRT
jgi:hypothetical protein